VQPVRLDFAELVRQQPPTDASARRGETHFAELRWNQAGNKIEADPARLQTGCGKSAGQWIKYKPDAGSVIATVHSQDSRAVLEVAEFRPRHIG